MSQSSKTLHEFGSLSIKEDLRLKLGSTSLLSASVTPAPTALADAAATLTVAQLRTGLFTITPTAARTLTLPTAALMSDFLTVVGDSIDFTIVNSGADTFHVTVAAGSGGTTVGFMVIRDSDATAASDIGAGRFRIRQTNVGSGTEAYIVYRLC